MPNQDLKLNNLVVSSGPHIQVEGDHIIKRMWATLIALIPAGIAGVYIFGLYSLNVIAVSVITAVICESAFQKIFRKKNTILDGSAIITGLLLAYNLPPSAPLWMAALGSFFAVVVGKQLFGGLGFNIFNPALVGRAFLMASWPKYMTYWSNPRWQIDAVTTATPLGIVKEKLSYQLPTYWDLFIGNRGGCIGEVCIIALLIGGVYLLYKRYISWQIPVHVFSRAPALITAFQTAGFRAGMTPGPTGLGGVADLGPLLLRVLASPMESITPSSAPAGPARSHPP